MTFLQMCNIMYLILASVAILCIAYKNKVGFIIFVVVAQNNTASLAWLVYILLLTSLVIINGVRRNSNVTRIKLINYNVFSTN